MATSTHSTGMTAGGVRVDAFLCDSVEGVGGKLFALGIGWNTIRAPRFPMRHSRIGIGLVIHVPYTATNEVHRFTVHFEDEDRTVLPLGDAGPGSDVELVEDDKVVRVGGQVNVGRPPDLPHGDEQTIAIALQLDQIEFMVPGRYAAVVTLDGNEEERLFFRLRQVQQMQLGVQS